MSEKVRQWHKIAELLTPEELRKEKKPPSPYLEVRLGARKTSFRVNYRQGAINLRKTLSKEFSDLKHWKKAQHRIEEMIGQAEYGAKPISEKTEIRTEALCDEIVKLKESKDPATLEHTERFFRLHIKPFLNGRCAYADDGKDCPYPSYLEAGACPYAKEFKPPVWLNYKTHLRLHNPTVTLFNHWKFFVMLARYLFEKGVIPQKLRLEYDEKKEDFRQRGMLIPDEHFRRMLAAANPAWRDRMILQRLTGQRPGLIRELRKDRLDRQAGILRIQKQDSKNRRAYEFVVPKPALAILEARLPGLSPYFFPSLSDPLQPMDKHLSGWKGALRRAGIDSKYTPHDLRHTRLTELFKTPGINHALTCYQHDLSLEEAMRTYIHFEATDTQVIARDAESKAAFLFPELPE